MGQPPAKRLLAVALSPLACTVHAQTPTSLDGRWTGTTTSATSGAELLIDVEIKDFSHHRRLRSAGSGNSRSTCRISGPMSSRCGAFRNGQSEAQKHASKMNASSSARTKTCASACGGGWFENFW